jgi:spore coat protein U-like protein
MLLAVALAMALVSVGSASTVNGTLNVSATVTAGACTVDNPSLNFGALSFPLANGVNGTGTITVTCSAGLGYQIDLSNGGGAFGLNRGLVGPDGLSKILYQLYTDQGHSQIWGSGMGGFVLSVTGTSAPQPIPVYGFVFSQSQPAVQGQYTDAVVITVFF